MSIREGKYFVVPIFSPWIRDKNWSNIDENISYLSKHKYFMGDAKSKDYLTDFRHIIAQEMQSESPRNMSVYLKSDGELDAVAYARGISLRVSGELEIGTKEYPSQYEPHNENFNAIVFADDNYIHGDK